MSDRFAQRSRGRVMVQMSKVASVPAISNLPFRSHPQSAGYSPRSTQCLNVENGQSFGPETQDNGRHFERPPVDAMLNGVAQERSSSRIRKQRRPTETHVRKEIRSARNVPSTIIRHGNNLRKVQRASRCHCGEPKSVKEQGIGAWSMRMRSGRWRRGSWANRFTAYRSRPAGKRTPILGLPNLPG